VFTVKVLAFAGIKTVPLVLVPHIAEDFVLEHLLFTVSSGAEMKAVNWSPVDKFKSLFVELLLAATGTQAGVISEEFQTSKP